MKLSSMKLSSMKIQIMSSRNAQMALQPHEVETSLPQFSQLYHCYE